MIRPVLKIAALYWATWLLMMLLLGLDVWQLFRDGYFMSVTMVFGSFVAGSTSVGGGAVAFPVMTLGFGISPEVARDFALMVQSAGMTAAALVIWRTGVRFEHRAVLYGTVGGAVGVIFGLEVIFPRLDPVFTKIFFTSFWLSFALALYWINRQHDRETHQLIQRFSGSDKWRLLAVATMGGIVSGMTGSGLDIVVFSLLVLAFRVDERVATPTAVILMGINAVVGFVWRATMLGPPISEEAWSYWYVCIPIVVIGAPVGAWFIRNKTRQFVSRFLYGTILFQFIAGLVVVPQTGELLLLSGATIAGGTALFGYMSFSGARRLRRKSARLTVDIDAVMHATGFAAVKGRIHTISASSIALVTEEPFPEDTALRVAFFFEGREVSLSGRVLLPASAAVKDLTVLLIEDPVSRALLAELIAHWQIREYEETYGRKALAVDRA